LIQDKFSKIYRAGKFVRLKDAKSSKAEKQKVWMERLSYLTIIPSLGDDNE